jgi:death on curing protein
VSDWCWIPLNVVLAVNDRQIAKHGGLSGKKDSGSVDSVWARTQDLSLYGNPDAADLAAA